MKVPGALIHTLSQPVTDAGARRYARVTSGMLTATRDDRPMALVTTSWDNGHPYDLRLASLLSTYQVAGTFYVPSSYSKRPMMEDSQLRDLIGMNMEIGSHTDTHLVLTKLPPHEIWRELRESRERLKSRAASCFQTTEPSVPDVSCQKGRKDMLPCHTRSASRSTTLPTFHNGDEVSLSKGTYQGTLGVFLNLKDDDPTWADILERRASGTHKGNRTRHQDQCTPVVSFNTAKTRQRNPAR